MGTTGYWWLHMISSTGLPGGIVIDYKMSSTRRSYFLFWWFIFVSNLSDSWFVNFEFFMILLIENCVHRLMMQRPKHPHFEKKNDKTCKVHSSNIITTTHWVWAMLSVFFLKKSIIVLHPLHNHFSFQFYVVTCIWRRSPSDSSFYPHRLTVFFPTESSAESWCFWVLKLFSMPNTKEPQTRLHTSQPRKKDYTLLIICWRWSANDVVVRCQLRDFLQLWPFLYSMTHGY
jgi:hypothetical protein